MVEIVTELAPNSQTVIGLLCDDSFRNRHQETVIYQHISCSDLDSFFSMSRGPCAPPYIFRMHMATRW